MMGLYYLVVIAIWIALTYLILRLWRGSRKKSGAKWVSTDTIFAFVVLVWLVASFWYGGGRKYYYDAEVNRLCAIDGGVKVYETVELPPEKFNEWGQVNFYEPMQGENALGSEYVYLREYHYFKRGNPDLFRIGTKIIRRSDEMLLGESAVYIRRDGDFPGPMHPSSFMCPESSIERDVLRQVFQIFKE
ncbi:MAG: hypothetical protein FWH15_02950 [Betaproteobacteria bacterium]|nr:hypothetical protein [Betaproteobacteria bacterium]